MENRARTWFFIGSLIGIAIIVFGFGIYTYNKNNISEMNVVNTQKLAGFTNEENIYNEMVNDIIETSSTNSNVSPNAIITEKRYYKSCDHLIREIVDVPEELINLGENEVKEYYSDWTIEQYSPTEIVVYREFNGICNEHYVVKEHEGVLGIYIENEEKVQEWLEDTEIELQYLPEKDVQEFKTGVRVVGKINLNTFLEDYE